MSTTDVSSENPIDRIVIKRYARDTENGFLVQDEPFSQGEDVNIMTGIPSL